MEITKSEYTKGNSTIIVDQVYTESLPLKEILKEYIQQKTMLKTGGISLRRLLQ